MENVLVLSYGCKQIILQNYHNLFNCFNLGISSLLMDIDNPLKKKEKKIEKSVLDF